MTTPSGTRTPAPGRARMTRDARREQLLDAAARIVVEEGTDVLTMEAVAIAVGASKTLGYAYFDNIAELALSLYQREAVVLAETMQRAVSEADGFEARIRAAARSYLEQMKATGPLLTALGGGVQSGQFGLRGARPFDPVLDVVAGVIDEEHGLGPDRARTFARFLGAVATIHADLLWRGKTDVASAEDELVAFVLGGIRGVLGR